MAQAALGDNQPEVYRMELRRGLASLLALAALLLPASLAAQTGAALAGTVTSDGRSLPGATVLVASPALLGVRVAITGANGTYSFAELPPGNYTVTLSAPEMGTIERRAELRLSQTARVDAELLPVMQTSMNVVAPAPSVLESPLVSTNLPLAFIERLPVQRNQLATAQLAPGVNGNTLGNGVLSIAGGPSYDNLVLVDGTVVTENVRGQMRPAYVEDAIQETTVLAGAVSAEYGRFSGGVVNTITRSGGNEWSGSLRDSLSNPKWSSATPAREEREDRLNHVWEGTLGGFVLRDRLWFFSSGRWANNDTARQTVAVPAGTTPATPASPPKSYTEGNDQKRFELKLTSQLGVRQSLDASYFKIDTEGTNARAANNVYDEASLTGRDDPETLLALHYTAMPGTSMLVEGRWSQRELGDRSGGTATDLIGGTVLFDRNNGNARFHAPAGCSVCGEERRDNDDLQLGAHWFVDAARLGSHDVAFGVDRFEEKRRAENHGSGSDFTLFVTRAQFRDGAIYPVVTPTNPTGGGTFIRWTPILAAAREDELRTDSAYVNDSWSLGRRWSLSLGARYDKNHAADADGTLASADARLSPRLAVQYDLRGDGRQHLSASFAQYAGRIAEGIATANQAAGSAAAIDFAYRGPALNDGALTLSQDEAIRRVFDWFESQQGGTANRTAANLRTGGLRTIPGYAAYFDGSLSSPAVREVTAGYGARLGRHGFARVDLVHRDWRDLYAQSVTTATRRATTPLGIPVDLALIRNSDDLERTYRGVLVQARWSSSWLDAGMHYTWSKLRGNDEGETANAGAIPNVDPALFYPEFLAYDRAAPVGYLQGDQRHRARAWVGHTFQLPGDGTLGATLLHSYESGLPYSVAAPINLTRYSGAPANPGYASIPNATYFFGGRGALRTEAMQSTDLALRYAVRLRGIAAVFGHGLQLFAQGDLLNAFNRHAIFDPQRIGTGVSTAANSPALLPFDPAHATPIECPRGASAQACTQMGANYQLANNFGRPLNDLAYQRPRTYRLSVGFRF